MVKFTQYVMLDAAGEPMMRCHQDDEEDPVVGVSPWHVLTLAAELSDFGSDPLVFLKKMGDGEEYAGYRIVRQDVEQLPLSAEELAEIEVLRRREQKQVDLRDARFAAGDYSHHPEDEEDDEEDEEDEDE